VTCFVTRFRCTFSGPLELLDGTVLQPAGKSFGVLYSTTAHRTDGKIVEEYQFYDNGTFTRQVGLA
jgi:hypothetical protein